MAKSKERAAGFIHSVRAGDRRTTPVILLHAASLDLTYWDAQFGREPCGNPVKVTTVKPVRSTRVIVAAAMPGRRSRPVI